MMSTLLFLKSKPHLQYPRLRSISLFLQVRGMHASVSVERRRRDTTSSHVRGRVSHVSLDGNVVVKAELEKGETVRS